MIREIGSDAADTLYGGAIKGYAACHFEAALALGYEIPEDEVIKRMLIRWGSKHDIIAPHVIGKHSRDIPERDLIQYGQVYMENLLGDNYLRYIKPVPGATDTLNYLDINNIGISIVTADPPELLNNVFNKLGIERTCFREILSSYDMNGGLNPKPSPDMLNEVMRRRGSDANQTWMVGDSVNDMLTGRRAGTPTVLVKTGEVGMMKDAGWPKRNGVTHVIKNFGLLPKLIEESGL